MALALFAEIHVRVFQAANAWYVQLLGESSFVAHDTEEVWELAENRSIAVEEQPENAGHGAVTRSRSTTPMATRSASAPSLSDPG